MTQPTNDDSQAGWRLVAGELRLPAQLALFGHRCLAVIGPDDRVVRQFNGLASIWDAASGRWRTRAVGWTSKDRLRVYDTRIRPDTFLLLHGMSSRSWSLSPALAHGGARIILSAAEQAELDARLAPLVAEAARINALTPGPDGGAGLPYPRLGVGGPNSNSVFSALLNSVGCRDGSPARCALFAPGLGRTLPGVKASGRPAV